MNNLVTGAASFIGSHLCEALMDVPAEQSVDRRGERPGAAPLGDGSP